MKEKPNDLDNYNKFLIDSINIYVHKSVKTTENNQLTLSTTGFFIFKDITVKGMDFTVI